SAYLRRKSLTTKRRRVGLVVGHRRRLILPLLGVMPASGQIPNRLSAAGEVTPRSRRLHTRRVLSHAARGGTMGRSIVRHKLLAGLMDIMVFGICATAVWAVNDQRRHDGRLSDFLRFSAPAGKRPATTDTLIDGVHAAVLPNGRLITPAGKEINVQAPK